MMYNKIREGVGYSIGTRCAAPLPTYDLPLTKGLIGGSMTTPTPIIPCRRGYSAVHSCGLRFVPFFPIRSISQLDALIVRYGWNAPVGRVADVQYLLLSGINLIDTSA